MVIFLWLVICTLKVTNHLTIMQKLPFMDTWKSVIYLLLAFLNCGNITNNGTLTYDCGTSSGTITGTGRMSIGSRTVVFLGTVDLGSVIATGDTTFNGTFRAASL